MPLAERLGRHAPGALSALALGGAFCVQFREVLFAAMVPSDRDLTRYYWPVKSLVAALSRASGGVPLWNPFLASGQPFAANPEHAVFHPLTALFLVLRFDWAFRLQILLPVALTAVAMFALARALSLSGPAAFLAAGSWAFGGYVLSTTNLLPILHAVAVLPAVLAFAVRIGRGGRLSDTGGLALSFGLEILAGEPSTLLMTGILAPAAALHGFLLGPASIDASREDRPTSSLAARAARLALGLALGCGVGSALLLPGAGHALKTSRAGGLPASAAHDWIFPPVRLLEAAVPDLCAATDLSPAAASWRRQLYPKRLGPFLLSVYPGLLVTCLSALALSRGGPVARIWLPVLLLGLLLAAGDALPVWPLLRQLPLLSGLRYPEKFLLLSSCAVTLSGAIGLDAVLAAPRRQGTILALALLGACAVLALLYLSPDRWLVRVGPPAVLSPRLLRQGLLAAALAAGGLLLSRSSRPGRAAAVLGLVSLGELVAAGRDLIRLETAAQLAAPPAPFRQLLASGFDDALFHLAAYHPTLGNLPGIASPPIPAQWRVRTALDRDFDLTELTWSTRATSAISATVRETPALAGPLLARRGIGAVLRFRPGAPTDPAEAVRTPVGQLLELSRVVGPRPLVFCVDRVVPVSSVAAWQAAVKELGSACASAAFVDAGAEGGRAALATALPEAPSPCRATVTSWRPGGLVLDVEAGGPSASVLAVNQTWDPGWSASVDGLPARYLLTDLSLGALAVSPGRHVVRLSYGNALVTAGIAVSVACLAVALALFRTPRGRARR